MSKKSWFFLGLGIVVVIGLIDVCSVAFSETKEEEWSHEEECQNQEKERFPNLWYKLDLYRARQAAFYANRYEIKESKCTSEKEFKEEAVSLLIHESGLANSYDLYETKKLRKKLLQIQSMKTPGMEKCYPEFNKVFIGRDSLSCQQKLLSYYKLELSLDQEELEKILNTCALAFHNQAQELGCFSLLTED